MGSMPRFALVIAVRAPPEAIAFLPLQRGPKGKVVNPLVLKVQRDSFSLIRRLR